MPMFISIDLGSISMSAVFACCVVLRTGLKCTRLQVVRLHTSTSESFAWSLVLVTMVTVFLSPARPPVGQHTASQLLCGQEHSYLGAGLWGLSQVSVRTRSDRLLGLVLAWHTPADICRERWSGEKVGC